MHSESAGLGQPNAHITTLGLWWTNGKCGSLDRSWYQFVSCKLQQIHELQMFSSFVPASLLMMRITALWKYCWSCHGSRATDPLMFRSWKLLKRLVYLLLVAVTFKPPNKYCSYIMLHIDSWAYDFSICSCFGNLAEYEKHRQSRE